tara:strand:- start:10 stop:252 length:243 start_codon:yes stop_codon:yes gene_type:complete
MQDQLDTPVFTIWSHRKFAAIGCKCACGRHNVVMLWQDICKRNLGIKTPRQIQKSLRCKKCGASPIDVVLVDYDDLPLWR